MRWIILPLWLILAMPVWADVDIQYELSTGNITAAHDTPPSIESAASYGIVTLTGVSLSGITWPVPSGCGAGRPHWTTITDAGTAAADGTGMDVRTGLVLFSTTSPLLADCFPVHSAGEVYALVTRTINNALGTTDPLTDTLTKLRSKVFRVCPSASGGACTNAHAKFDAISNVQPGDDSALDTFLGYVETLKSDADTFVGTNFP
jgi:hypothetical protein